MQATKSPAAGLVGWCRVVVAEIYKILSHPFLYISVAILLVAIPLWTQLQIALGDYKETDYRKLNSFLLFCYGARFGLKFGMFVLVIFSSMSFAGEFDKGTIKNLLTRPVTRTELFLAKCVTLILLAVFLIGLVFYLSAVVALLQGEAHHVWKESIHEVYPKFEELMEHSKTAILMCIVPILATAFLGIVVSNLTESSGYAVAAALILFFALDIAAGVTRAERGMYLFNFYQTYPFEILQKFAKGGSDAMWDARILQHNLFLTVPAIYSVVFGVISYVLFRFKNITV